MHLYGLTLQKATAIHKVIYGNFSHSKAQELVVSKGKILELLRPDASGKLQLISSQEVFGIIRSIATFRLTGNNRDYVVVGSDSGRIVILIFDNEKNLFDKVHQETFGKTGCRRIVPGQYYACDPKGRAIMVSALEKQKFVYILNRDASNKLTISSPLEAHKSHTLVFDTCAVDVGYENPLFAVLEVDYGDIESQDAAVHTGNYEKMLTYYEMDLGLNHVIRKQAEVVPQSAHSLIPVPGVPDGPGGVLVCCEGKIVYKTLQKGFIKECEIPIRAGTSALQLVNSFGSHKQKDLFFFLLQTELGDLFKLSLHFTKDEVHNLQITYFDTIPVASSLCVLKSGYLFAACEQANHSFYSFVGLGEEDTITCHSGDPAPSFTPRVLTNLSLVQELDNMGCITDLQIQDLTGEGTQQIYTLCAAQHQSTLRILRHGLAVQELAVSELPAAPLSIFTVQTDDFTKYIILSFKSQSLVLSVGEKVTEVNDSGLDVSKHTVFVGVLENGAIIQVTNGGIRQIRADGRVEEWKTEGRIVKATSNTRQLAIALEGGEVIYFELDTLGQLVETEKMRLDAEVVAMSIGKVPQDMQRCKFLTVGLADYTVKLFSLDPETCLQRLGTQALPALPESVCIIEMAAEEEEQIYLYVGLTNGVLLKTVIDNITGNLTDTRTRFLGSKPVKLFQISINKQDALLALSSRPWVCYHFQGNQLMVPLSYETMDFAAAFSSSVCTDGIVGISGHTLRIIMPERLGEVFNQAIVPLRYNPRKICVSSHKFLVISECSHRTYNQEQSQQLLENLQPLPPQSQIGPYPAPAGTWSSCIRIFSPSAMQTLQLYELQDNECITAVKLLTFANDPTEYLFCGIAKNLNFEPLSAQNYYVDMYRVEEDGGLGIVHRTGVDGLVGCFEAFRSNLLVGTGDKLRQYEIGKKKLLKKSENREFQGGVIGIQILNERVFVTDKSNSVHVYKYKQKDGTFFEIADDILPRWITSVTILDYQTIACSDKFENFFVLRLPLNLDEEILQDSVAYKNLSEIGRLNGAPYKFEPICNFYVGDMITTMAKTSLISTANEVIVYATAMGGIGAFYPFETREDVDFFMHLELFLRQEMGGLVGRDHISFRSSFVPVKAVIDGDLCEEFGRLGVNKQKYLSEELDRTPSEVLKKLEDVRNKIL